MMNTLVKLIPFLIIFESINIGDAYPLVITEVRAWDLPDHDGAFSGISDPYVIMYKCSSI